MVGEVVLAHAVGRGPVRVRREVAEALRSAEQRWLLTYRIRHKDGEWRWIEATARPFGSSNCTSPRNACFWQYAGQCGIACPLKNGSL